MLPEGWTNFELNQVTDTITGFAFRSESFLPPGLGTVRLLRGDNVMQGYLRWDGAKHFPGGKKEFERYELRPGDVVIALDRPVTKAGLKCSVISNDDLPCLLVQRVARLRASDKLHHSYLAQLMQSDSLRAHLQGNKTETAVPHVSPNDLRSFKFSAPMRLSEQCRIAEILEAWGAAIATAEKLLTNSQRQRRAISRALLSGQRRLDSAGIWREKKLSDLIVESRIPGSSGDVARKLTVKLYGKGVVAKGARRQGSESTTYYRRRAGQFIYSKLDFLNGAFGVIPEHLDGYESTLDLPAFDFLEDINPRWFLHHVSREEFYNDHLGLANGGRKARRVNPQDLMQVSISCPPFDEQTSIANAIDIACEDERKWEASCSLLKEERRALMADLLTGKRRVRLPESAEASPEAA